MEYFISHFDYYQPEAYIPRQDLFIEKDSSINEEIDEMRHSATAALMDYKDVIVVASVSCIYGIGDPDDYRDSMLNIRVGESYNKKELLTRLVEMQFERNDIDFKRGSFRVRGDVVEIIPINEHAKGIRIEFFEEEVERIRTFDVTTGVKIADVAFANIFAATHFVTNKSKLEEALRRIKAELQVNHKNFILDGKPLEAERIEQRTKYDIEMLEQTGTCSGVENYSRHLALRGPGETPTCLIDFFPKDFLSDQHFFPPKSESIFPNLFLRNSFRNEYGLIILIFNLFQRRIYRIRKLSFSQIASPSNRSPRRHTSQRKNTPPYSYSASSQNAWDG